MATFHRLDQKAGEFVLAKFEQKCTNCGSDKDLCIHHIVKMKPTDERYNEVENLTVLCRPCHMSLHRNQKDIPEYPGERNGRRGKGNPVVFCSHEGCEEKQHARTLCRKHYRIAFPEKFYSKQDQIRRKIRGQ